MNKGINILIVDDNLINRKYFSMSLLKSGFNVTTAENGQQAIKETNLHHFDVILMDIRMPDLNGFEVSKFIKKSQHNKHTPIIATSAEKITEEEKSLFADFLLKPISPTDLSFKIQKYCQQSLHLSFDEKQALDFAYNDVDIMRKLLLMFTKDLPIQISFLSELLAANEYDKASQLTHKLRGSCKTCGAIDLDKKINHLDESIKLHDHQKIQLGLSDVQKSKETYLELIKKIIA